MKTKLLWKFFGLNLLIIGFVVLIVWGAVDYLAEGYFVVLMEKYHISPTESHQMFIDSIHRYLIWGSVCAVLLAAVISYFTTKRILGPLAQMSRITRQVATGDFNATIPVATRDEVGELAHAFNRMTASLNHVEQLRRTMIVDVAHEFKTPLTNIRGYVEGLMDDVVPRSEETYRLLKAESERLDHLVTDVLKLARAGSARVHLDAVDIHVREAVIQVCGPLLSRFAEKNISVETDGIDEECRVYADPNKLAQIFLNLLENALQYTPAGGHLRVSAERTPRNVRITFANSKGNFRAEDLPLVFERFFRGEKSRSREHGGAGIGLALVKELVEAHRGQADARVEDGEFQIRLTLPGKRP